MSKIRNTVLAGTLAGVMLVTAGGCKKEESKNTNGDTTPTTSIVVDVDAVKTDLKTLFPKINEDMLNNASIMLSLEQFIQKDENGKISAEAISKFKNNIDVDNMMNDFNSFLDMVQEEIKNTHRVPKISTTLDGNQLNDKKILAEIEVILDRVIEYVNNNNKEGLFKEISRLKTLFVDKDKITLDGLTFEIEDLSLTARAVANNYAEAAIFIAKDYIKENLYKAMDKALNDQDNKPQTREALAILANEVSGNSEVENLISEFEKLYTKASNDIDPKIKTSEQSIKDLVNILNMDYLKSEKVSYKDKTAIFNGYDDDRLEDVINLIKAITEYNFRNENNIVDLKNYLLPEYLKTETGKNDSIALDFVLFNAYNSKISAKEIKTLIDLKNNYYSNNLFLYFTRQDFVHENKDENGNIVEYPVKHHETSDGVDFINNTIISYTLNKYFDHVEDIDNYTAKTSANVTEGIKAIQVVITGECDKGSDIVEFVGSNGIDGEIVLTIKK